MSKKESTYPCDHCNRVVAKEDANGDLVITLRHDKEEHVTVIPKKCEPEKGSGRGA